MPINIIQVDAFTDRPFAGNPAAVCILEQERPAAWMQQVATEMNLSETAFLVKQPDGYRLRWFTPAIEVNLCGHATLASAHTLWTEGHLPANQAARFHTRSGLLTCRQHGEWIEMDFPARHIVETTPPDGLLTALGVEAEFVGYDGKEDYLVEIASAEALRQLQPKMDTLIRVKARGVVVTSRSDEPAYQFISRFFGPRVGIAEDPVTGSAHCTLAPYWGARLQMQQMTAFQASRRGGVVRMKLAGDRVILGGQAVTVMRGELLA